MNAMNANEKAVGSVAGPPLEKTIASRHWLRRLLPFFSLIALFVGLAISSPPFLSARNLSSVVRQTAVINIMALGMTLIIVAGGIDLSVGAILGFAGWVGARAMEAQAPYPLGILIGM